MNQWDRLDRLFRTAERLTNALLRDAGEYTSDGFVDRVTRLKLLGRLTQDAAMVFVQAAKVRNAVYHDRRFGPEPIAMPSRAFVDHVAAACEELAPTVRLGEQFKRSIDVFSAARPLREALLYMREKDFSQVVVDVGQGKLQVLTAEDVAHWLMDRIAEGDDQVAMVATNAPISDALPAKRPDTYKFMPADGWLRDAIEAFRHAAGQGKRLQAILLTKDGKAKGPPVGIVTPHDLPGVAG